MKIFFIVALSLLAPLTVVAKGNAREAVGRIMAEYPEAELQDVYKSFFQDEFGPGHLIGDTAAAANFLRRELAADAFPGAQYEKTGAGGNFYRVNLSVVKSGLVPFDKFVSAFVRSANSVKAPTIEHWTEKWHGIRDEIADMNPRPARFEEGSAAIDSLLARGQYAFHHSRAYNRAYQPHYRIISRDIFEAEILPMLR